MKARLCDLCKGPAWSPLDQYSARDTFRIRERMSAKRLTLFLLLRTPMLRTKLDICPSCWERIGDEARAAQENR